MPRLRAPAISALIVLLGLALPVQAAPAPIVFDFEDGVQGWELQGAATRVQTQVLDGEWAIFGDAPIQSPPPPGLGYPLEDTTTYIFLPIDITNIEIMTVDFFFAGSSEDPGDFIYAGSILGKEEILGVGNEDILFFGDMTFAPKLDAAHQLVEHIMPLIWSR